MCQHVLVWHREAVLRSLAGHLARDLCPEAGLRGCAVHREGCLQHSKMLSMVRVNVCLCLTGLHCLLVLGHKFRSAALVCCISAGCLQHSTPSCSDADLQESQLPTHPVLLYSNSSSLSGQAPHKDKGSAESAETRLQEGELLTRPVALWTTSLAAARLLRGLRRGRLAAGACAGSPGAAGLQYSLRLRRQTRDCLVTLVITRQGCLRAQMKAMLCRVYRSCWDSKQLDRAGA